ncbi:Tex family protein [Alkalicoccus urumqiensis]|uniref:RNA-binding transcriptional accessory protein n=1 Tax=Alkalicoccus urumqiensis TaxID=1548213 RepID=A0A2P6MI04_ALKUR|nr:Tex family protein [Alkalicoccus urumqiensis]PRO65890.1 RNA-binding transcriptional accessory protein [Alkalicoccus urumqiensis]
MTAAVEQIAKAQEIRAKSVEQVISLSEEGNTVPFIARYRKEQTGGLDEEEIRAVLEQWQYIQSLEKRKEEVLRLVEEQGKLTEELESRVKEAERLQTVEDLYRPFKQKRKTRAVKAKERGLEPLAALLAEGSEKIRPLKEAESYVTEDLSAEDALQGALDIIAEQAADDPEARSWIRRAVWNDGVLMAEKKAKAEDEKEVFALYYEFRESVKRMVPHRTLAVNRGEKEEILRVKVEPPEESVKRFMEKKWITYPGTEASNEVIRALEDARKRLIYPAVERDIRNELTEKAENHAIDVFSQNLRQLLLQPPLRGRAVLGVDPAYRTGCKLAAVDPNGKFLEAGVIFPTPPRNEVEKSKKTVLDWIKRHQITMIAIGNGTASRETEQFIADVMKETDGSVYFVIVNEAGASVYSASKAAKAEFPELKVEERSAVSIARRLQDPLAELVKIDPQSVGVGQYQHDVSQTKLAGSLQFVVETVVNRVGVNVNTASQALLQYVSGLSSAVAGNIVKHREENGPFTKRTELKKIPRLGAKTYEQAVGFLRIPEGRQPLDATAVHPESYAAAEEVLRELGLTAGQIGSAEAEKAAAGVDSGKLAEKTNTGLPTIQDILEAVQTPGRDPRDEVAEPLLKQDVLNMEDLESGMELEGTVRNVVDFGAFVDIGVKQDGLVHVSKMAERFIKNPMEVVSVGDVVTVWVEQVDAAKGRISLTMKQPKSQ